ncbi:hypothetical protein [Thalassospira profundimaris]|uniref:hypothetical protein n=1 Tax=Thalassospira profundimaris TaxID=502049 RepID=UPI000DEDD013|nr:hypothetical protein [Thalassospira profundimaris]
MAERRVSPNHSSYLPAIYFFVTFAFGACAIVALKLFGAHQVIVTAVPVLIMVAFAIFSWVFRSARMRLDQTGDNLYYLGFLYTLVSLAYSLIEFTVQTSGTASIITNFGIAIFTTIFGLAFRVLFSQIRQDPYETERVARVELAESARRVRDQLDEASREFSMFSRTLRQSVDEGFEETKQSLDKFLEEGMGRFEKGLNEFSSSVEKANEGFESRTDALTQSSDKLVGTINGLAARIENIRVSENLLEEQLAPTMLKLQSSAAQIDGASGEIASKIKSIQIPTDLIEKQLSSAVQELRNAAQAMEATAQHEAGKTAAWQESVDALAVSASSLRRDFGQMDEATERLCKTIESVSASAEKVGQLPENLKAVNQQVEAFSRTVEESSSRYSSAIDRAIDSIRSKPFWRRRSTDIVDESEQ